MPNKKILVVDDSGSMRVILSEMLNEAGFKDVRTAVNGEDAVFIAKVYHPDLILLDIIMPGINGMDALKLLGKITKVIIISAVGQDSVMAEAKELGAIDYITKPLNKDDVIKKITEALK